MGAEIWNAATISNLGPANKISSLIKLQWVRKILKRKKVFNPCTEDVNWTYIRRSEDVHFKSCVQGVYSFVLANVNFKS